MRTLDEIVEHYKKGYELIHRIRELVTQQDIVYSILYSTRRRKNGFKPLLEAHLTLDQVLEHMRPAYSDIKKVKNFKTEFSNVISLSFANADARRAVNEAEREGLSISNAIEKRELWDTLEEYAEIYYPKVNRGRLYEVYSILVKTPDYEGIEHVGHYEGQANTETLAGDLIEKSLKDTDYGWQKGDIALEQLKAAYNANVSFMEASTVKRVLKEILVALKSQSQEAMIEELTKVFTVAKTEFNLEVDKLVKEEAEVAIAEKIKEGNLFDIK